jgi:hypothetical protein
MRSIVLAGVLLTACSQSVLGGFVQPARLTLDDEWRFLWSVEYVAPGLGEAMFQFPSPFWDVLATEIREGTGPRATITLRGIHKRKPHGEAADGPSLLVTLSGVVAGSNTRYDSIADAHDVATAHTDTLQAYIVPDVFMPNAGRFFLIVRMDHTVPQESLPRFPNRGLQR